MAFDNVCDFNVENNQKYIDFLNKELSFSINKTSEFATLFLQAITAPAYSKKYNESKNIDIKIKNYDPIEFKGDAIISYVVVTEILEDEPVGRMHDKKTKLIANKHFVEIFNLLDLQRFVYVDNVNDISDGIKADIIEALVYAMYKSSKTKMTEFLKKYLTIDKIISKSQ